MNPIIKLVFGYEAIDSVKRYLSFLEPEDIFLHLDIPASDDRIVSVAAIDRFLAQGGTIESVYSSVLADENNTEELEHILLNKLHDSCWPDYPFDELYQFASLGKVTAQGSELLKHEPSNLNALDIGIIVFLMDKMVEKGLLRKRGDGLERRYLPELKKFIELLPTFDNKHVTTYLSEGNIDFTNENGGDLGQIQFETYKVELEKSGDLLIRVPKGQFEFILKDE